MPLCKFPWKNAILFFPLVTLLAWKKMAPANPVDRTVQQAGKHRNKDKPKNPWTNKKNIGKTKNNLEETQKTLGKKNEKNGKHIKHTHSLERGCFREESLIFFCVFCFPIIFYLSACFSYVFCFFHFFLKCVSFFLGGSRPPPNSMEVICAATLQRVCKQFFGACVRFLCRKASGNAVEPLKILS